MVQPPDEITSGSWWTGHFGVLWAERTSFRLIHITRLLDSSTSETDLIACRRACDWIFKQPCGGISFFLKSLSHSILIVDYPLCCVTTMVIVFLFFWGGQSVLEAIWSFFWSFYFAEPSLFSPVRQKAVVTVCESPTLPWFELFTVFHVMWSPPPHPPPALPQRGPFKAYQR